MDFSILVKVSRSLKLHEINKKKVASGFASQSDLDTI